MFGGLRLWAALILLGLAASLSVGAASAQDAGTVFKVEDGAAPWSDQPQATFDGLPASIKGGGPFPRQAGDGKLSLTTQAASILVGVAEVHAADFEALPLGATKTGETFVVRAADGNATPYLVYRVPHPPVSFGSGVLGGLILLKLDASPSAVVAALPAAVAPLEIADPTKFDIYLLMGQSNMLGRDTTGIASQHPDPRVGALSPEGKWLVAVEPIGAGGTGFGPGTFFAAEMLKEKPGAQIGLVQCAVGGTPLRRWVKGADLYERAVKRAKLAVESGGTLRGVLWHQGESDATDPQNAATYRERLRQMLADLRSDLGMPDLPVVVGQLSDFDRGSEVETVRAALRALPGDLPRVGYADAKGLKDKGDHIHFNVDGQKVLGGRFAEAMRALQSDGAKASEVSPEVADGIVAIKALTLDRGTIVEATREVSSTMVLPDGKTLDHLPPRTVVKIVLNPAKGSNIRVEIWLPDAGKWNGRLLGQGNGGAAGSIPLSSLAGPAAGGYTVATTDMGTTVGMAPNADSGIGNPEVWKDFGYRATHLMTVVAKQVVKAYYGRGPDYAYFNGRSTGGQQALQEAQRYPDDYDGIVAGVPAHCRTPLHAYFLWNDQILAKCPFTPSQEKSVIDAGVEYMASRQVPVLAGKMIADPRCDTKDIDAVVKLAMEKDASLTPAHAEALRKLFDGPRSTLTGERIFDGLPFGSPLDSLSHGNLYLFKWVFGKDKNLATIDFGKDIDTYTAALGPYLNAESLDLAPFAARGGKLLMVSGAADSCVPYTATLDYYERVVERFGGDLPKVQAFFRYFIVPGLTHRTGPLNSLPNQLDLVIQWREKGVAPGEIRGRRIVDGKTEIDVPIYPYPAKAVWDEGASAYKAVDGPRGGVDRIAERFRPPAAE